MEELEKKECPYCGAEINFDAKKCRHCGEWVNSSEKILPKELQKFNWGAFLLNWIWGVMHGKYITLLYFPACLIPVIGPFVVSIWFGIFGNEWAWKSNNWATIDEFNNSQRFWAKLGVILFVLGTIITLKVFMILFLIANIQQ